MWDRIKSWFKPQPIVIYRVIESGPSRTQLSGGDEEMRGSVQTLSSHPGFVWLQARLAAQNAALSDRLKYTHHSDIREVDFLQAGIFWSNWLTIQLEQTTSKASSKRVVDPFEEELRAFKEIDNAIERVTGTPDA
jgi:hypothetical protein